MLEVKLEKRERERTVETVWEENRNSAGREFVTVIVSGALVYPAAKTGRGFRLRTQMDRSV